MEWSRCCQHTFWPASRGQSRIGPPCWSSAPLGRRWPGTRRGFWGVHAGLGRTESFHFYNLSPCSRCCERQWEQGLGIWGSRSQINFGQGRRHFRPRGPRCTCAASISAVIHWPLSGPPQFQTQRRSLPLSSPDGGEGAQRQWKFSELLLPWL